MLEMINDPTFETVLVILTVVLTISASMFAYRSISISRKHSLLSQRVYRELASRPDDNEYYLPSSIAFRERDRDRNEIDSVTRTYLEKLQHELYENRQLSMEVRNMLAHSIIPLNERNLENIADIVKDAIHNQSPEVATEKGSASKSEIVKEINHALKTPLASITALTKVLEDSENDNTRRITKQIATASQLCNYYLNAFRSLVYEGGIRKDDNNIDFERSLVEAIRIYEGQIEKDLEVHIDVPEKQSSVSLYYAIAVIMPLIENAVEAAPDGTTVEIEGREMNGILVLHITNDCQGRPSSEILNRGYTTKDPDANEGLGLTIVRNLLSGLSIGEFSYHYNASLQRITFSLKMANKQ